LTIAIADAFSDALAIHISEESERKHTTREIWEATISTFLSKFVFALTFLLPLSFFPLSFAILVSVVYGLALIGIFSFYIAKEEGIGRWKVVIEHLLIALVVVGVTHYVGDWIRKIFV
jgi:VIT1/CCC1 family predicted Fe2+/Mn2+ transporter